MENHILLHSFVKTLTFIYSYSSYLLDVPRQQIQFEQDYVEKGLLGTKLFANSLRTKCTYVWMGQRACTASSVNGSSTILCKPKFVGFLREYKGNLQVSSCLWTVRLLPAFLAFFQYGLINVCWVRIETMIHLTFKENWFTVHLVRIVCKSHNGIKVCSVCQVLGLFHTAAKLLFWATLHFCNTLI